MQVFWAEVDGKIAELRLPSPSAVVLGTLKWGSFDELFTPAFWASRVFAHACDDQFNRYRLGDTLIEELTACLLGGYGIPAEVGLAVFERLRQRGLLIGLPTRAVLLSTLTEPVVVGGKSMRYRFPEQKATYLHAALSAFSRASPVPVENPLALRAFLLSLQGVGPKTASWIVRNHCDSDEVAIIDVHVHRAGNILGLFREPVSSPQGYFRLEQKFLNFSEAIAVRPSMLDNVMWQYMRKLRSWIPATHC